MENNIYNTDNLTCYNNPTFVKQMLHSFVKISNEYLLEIDIAIKNNDLTKVNQLAHHIKPSIDLLNIKSISTPIREIEKATSLDNDVIELINFTKKQLLDVNKKMIEDLV